VQIRVANRQDEPDIRTFVDSLYKETGGSVDLESSDSDLRNIEANYFGKEGLIIVAEDEGKIVGIAGARKKSESVLEVKRLLVGDSDRFSRSEVMNDLLKVVVEFAPRLLYEQIEFGSPTEVQQSALKDRGFSPANGNGTFTLKVTPDF